MKPSSQALTSSAVELTCAFGRRSSGGAWPTSTRLSCRSQAALGRACASAPDKAPIPRIAAKKCSRLAHQPLSPLPNGLPIESIWPYHADKQPDGDIMSLIREIVKSVAEALAMSAHPTLGSILRDLRNHRGWTLKEMSEQQRDSGLDAVEGRARPADPDLRQAASAQPEAAHPHVGTVRRSGAGWTKALRRGEASAGIDDAVRVDHAQLRLLLSVHRASPEADDPGADAHPRQITRASSAISSAIRARNISMSSRAASSSTPNSTIR